MDSKTFAPANPLSNFMRQPKIYIKLPSNGQYWADGSLEMTETGEFPVYSMTARDEMLLKIPDALMNGQAVVDVIQNCIPNIKNAWMTPSIDMDVILIAIRLATYGEMMTTPLPIELEGDSDLEYQIDLRVVLDNLMNTISWNNAVPINEEITIFVRPAIYKQQTKMSLQTFETQRILQIASNESLNEEDKVSAFKNSFNKLTSVTIDLIGECIYRVDTSQGSTEDPSHIKDFVRNMDKSIFNTVQKHLENLKDQNSIKPIILEVTDEMREKGITGETLEIPLVFDVANFFA